MFQNEFNLGLRNRMLESKCAIKDQFWNTYTHTHMYYMEKTYIQYTYIHTYTHIYIHTYIHKYIHMYVHTYIHTYIFTYIHTYIHT